MIKLCDFLVDAEKQSKVVPFLSVLFGFLIGAAIMLVSGYSPMEAYGALLKGAGFFGDMRRFGDTLLNATTLIFTGLAVAFAFRTGLFNIGVSGQMLMGGFWAVYIGNVIELPKLIHMPLAIIVAAAGGAIWGLLPGLLKAKYRIHEVVTTIMMNWIAYWTVYDLVPALIPGNFDTESSVIRDSASLRVGWLEALFNGSYVNIALFIALFAAVFIWWMLNKTTFGFELRAVGFSPDAAEYAGMKVNRNIIYSMMISGALAGLAGAAFYLGYTDNIKIGVLPTQGFDGIAVALLGLNTPLGAVLAAFLFGAMNAGKLFMQSSTDVPNELVSIIIATIIFFAATNLMIKGWLSYVGNKLQKSKGGEE